MNTGKYPNPHVSKLQARVTCLASDRTLVTFTPCTSLSSQFHSPACPFVHSSPDQNQNWRDARASFILVAGDEDSNGSLSPSATVKRMSINPSLDADVHLNPPGGMLSGTDRATAFGGWVYFRDLFVRTRGQGYKMNFEAVLSDLKLAALSASSVSSYSALTSSASSSSSSGGNGGGGEGGVALKQSTTFEVSRLLCSWSVGTYRSMKHRASHSMCCFAECEPALVPTDAYSFSHGAFYLLSSLAVADLPFIPA